MLLPADSAVVVFVCAVSGEKRMKIEHFPTNLDIIVLSRDRNKEILIALIRFLICFGEKDRQKILSELAKSQFGFLKN